MASVRHNNAGLDILQHIVVLIFDSYNFPSHHHIGRINLLKLDKEILLSVHLTVIWQRP